MKTQSSTDRIARLILCGGLLAQALAPMPASGDTIIAGGNIINQIWDAAGSPYIVMGDVTVPVGSFLNIEGAEVRFASSDAQASGMDPAKVELIVAGTLNVANTHLRGVVTSGAGNWFGVRATLDGILNVTSVRFSHATQAVRIEGNAANVEFNNVEFTPTSGMDIFTLGTTSPNVSGTLSGSKVTGPLHSSSLQLRNSNSPGPFQFDGDLILRDGVTYFPRLESAVRYDSIVASSTVTLQNAFFHLDTSSLSAQVGDTFRILDKTSSGPLIGAFLYPEGAQFSSSSYEFRISYVGGDGNDVVLTVIPEPAVSTLLFGAALLAGLRRRGKMG